MKRFEKFLSGRGFITGIMVILVLFVSLSYAEAEESNAKGFLGVSVEKLSAVEMKEMDVIHGVRVVDVVEGEAAEKAGIKEDDIIQYFNQNKIESPEDLGEAVRSTQPATEVKIKLVRDKKPKEVNVVLGSLKSRSRFFHWLGGKRFSVYMKGGTYLGIHMHKLNPELAEYFKVKADSGVLILQIEGDSPAQKAGLKAGDVVVQMNDKKIQVPDDISRMISEMAGGEKVDMTVIRHGKKEMFKVELGEGKRHREWNISKWRKGHRCKIEIPEIGIPDIEVEIPDFEECEVIIHKNLEKVERKLEKVREKIRHKIKYIQECFYI